MTNEGQKIAAMVDQFPQDVRVRMVDAMKRITRAAAESLPAQRALFPDLPAQRRLPSNVIAFPRRSKRASSRAANACGAVRD